MAAADVTCKAYSNHALKHNALDNIASMLNIASKLSNRPQHKPNPDPNPKY